MAIPPRSARLSRRAWLALLALPGARAAGEVEAAEYGIKAAFLCKFGHYVDWPAAAADSPFVIGVLATAAVAEAIENAAQGQSVQGRAVAVRTLVASDGLDGLAIVFVARSHEPQWSRVAAAAAARPVLTVSEAVAGPPPGSMINFAVVDDKVRFDVVLPEARRAGLRISARLLGVARHVLGAPS